jgi:hypothetical protein
MANNTETVNMDGMQQVMFDTASFGDLGQRRAPVEHIGMMIATKGTKPYVHLQLEQARRLFGDSMPTLVCNDGPDEAGLAELCAKYGAEFRCDEKPLGHTTGDIRNFVWGLEWAQRANVQILVKFSRRFVPLVPWRWQLQYLAGVNRYASAFTRYHEDSPISLFRTDAIALRVQKWASSKEVSDIFAESMKMPPEQVNVESIFGSLMKGLGGWEMWDLLGRDFYRAAEKAIQWRGVMPSAYSDLSRWLGLPYTDRDFMDGTLTVPHYLTFDPKEQERIAAEIKAVEDAMPDPRPKGAVVWRIADNKEQLGEVVESAIDPALQPAEA